MKIYLDFESYYDKVYSLAHMSIEAYVRDPRFEPLLLTVAVDNGPVMAFLPEKIPAALQALPLGHPNVYTYAHNAKFDMFIIEQYYNICVANPVCTYGLARYAGVSRVCREGLAALVEGLGLGKKALHVRENMMGRRLADLDTAGLQEFVQYGKSDTYLLRSLVRELITLAVQPVAGLDLGQGVADAEDFVAMTTRMYTQPRLVLDRALLEKYQIQLARRAEEDRQRLMQWFHFDNQAAFFKELRSAARFSTMLESLGVEVPLKVSAARTKTMKERAAKDGIDPESVADVWIPALAKNDLEFVALREHPDPRVAALVEARLGNNTSAAMSRCATFLAASARGPVPVPLEPYQAHTGRYAAGTVAEVHTDAFNFQNLGKRQGDKTLRRCICAPEGYVLVAADSSQVEARVGAWLAGEAGLLRAFQRGEDPYCQFAGVIYGVDATQLRLVAKALIECTADEQRQAVFYRNVGKEGILSSQYQIGYKKFGLRLLQYGIRLAPDDAGHYEEARRINRLYRATYTSIANMWNVCEDVLVRMIAGDSGWFGGPEGKTLRYVGREMRAGHQCSVIYLPDGFPLVYANLRIQFDTERKRWTKVYDRVIKGRWQTKSIYGGLLFENITQGFAFAAMRYQATKEYRLAPVAPLVMNSHDEWVALARCAQASMVQEELARCMRTAPPWAQGIPFDCDPPSVGANYGEV